jgi:phenylalanyl-tRNA synthetase alpha chain
MAPTGVDSTADLSSQLLQVLSQQDPIQSTEAFPNVPSEVLKGAIDRLASRSMVTYERAEREEAILEPEAETIVAHGSHEARVFEAVHKAMGGLSLQDLEKEIGDKTIANVGRGKAFKEKWIKKDGDQLIALVRTGLLC